MSLHLESFRTGPLDNNEYLLWDDATRELVIVDPSIGGDASLGRAQELVAQGIVPREIWLTHGHFDHVYGVPRWKSAFDVPIRLHPADEFLLARLREQSLWFGLPAPSAFAPDATFQDGQTIYLGEHAAQVMLLPGHSPGSVAFHFAAHAFVVSGDVLFRGSIGRVDLPGASARDLNASLRRLTSLPAATRVLPGHGDASTVAQELQNNPYCRFAFHAPD